MEALFKFWTSGKCLQRPGRCAKVYKKEALALKPHSPERRHLLGCRLRGQGAVCRINKSQRKTKQVVNFPLMIGQPVGYAEGITVKVARFRPRLKERQSWTCTGRVAGPLLGAPSPSLS